MRNLPPRLRPIRASSVRVPGEPVAPVWTVLRRKPRTRPGGCVRWPGALVCSAATASRPTVRRGPDAAGPILRGAAV